MGEGRPAIYMANWPINTQSTQSIPCYPNPYPTLIHNQIISGLGHSHCQCDWLASSYELPVASCQLPVAILPVTSCQLPVTIIQLSGQHFDHSLCRLANCNWSWLAGREAGKMTTPVCIFQQLLSVFFLSFLYSFLSYFLLPNAVYKST